MSGKKLESLDEADTINYFDIDLCNPTSIFLRRQRQHNDSLCMLDAGGITLPENENR